MVSENHTCDRKFSLKVCLLPGPWSRPENRVQSALTHLCNGNDGSVCDDSRGHSASFRTNRLQHNRAGLCRYIFTLVRYFSVSPPDGLYYESGTDVTYRSLKDTSVQRLGPRSQRRAKRSLPLKTRLLLACIGHCFATLMHHMQASREPLNGIPSKKLGR